MNLSQVTKKKSQVNGPRFSILRFYLCCSFSSNGWLAHRLLLDYGSKDVLFQPLPSPCHYHFTKVLFTGESVLDFFFLQKEINIHKAHTHLHTTQTHAHKHLLNHLRCVFLDETKCVHYLTVQSVVWISGEKFQA